MSTANNPIAVLPISMDAPAPDLMSLADYVKLTYPANFQADDGNYAADAFKLRTTAGTCLEFYNGRLYMAINNFVYCTRSHDIEHYDIRYNVVAGFPGAVRLIVRVNDGLYIATDTDTYFLRGEGPYEKDVPGSGFQQRHVMKYGAIYGTATRLQSELVPDAQTADTVVLWASTIGVVEGGNGGNYKLLSLNQTTMPSGISGTSFIREHNGVYLFIVCFNVGSDLFVNAAESVQIDNAALLDTWVVNVANSMHSRYTGYAFNSFFRSDGIYYGSNALGIYELSGDTDFAGEQDLDTQIDAFVLTPVTDMNHKELKFLYNAYISARSAVDLAIDVIVNEETVCSGIPVVSPTYSTGVHRTRGKMPRGLKGSAVQFKIKNNNGAYFKLFDLEVSAATSQRSI